MKLKSKVFFALWKKISSIPQFVCEKSNCVVKEDNSLRNRFNNRNLIKSGHKWKKNRMLKCQFNPFVHELFLNEVKTYFALKININELFKANNVDCF